MRPTKRMALELSVEDQGDSLRGLASGVVEAEEVLRPCVVFGNTYPCWLPALRLMGCRPVLVVTRYTTFLDEIEKTVPPECAVWVGHDWNVLAAKPFKFVSSPMVAFVDGSPSPDMLSLCTHMNIPAVYGTQSPRRSPKDWTRRRVNVNHELVGGVSQSQSNIVVMLHSTATYAHIVTPREREDVDRDLSTLLYDHTAHRPRFSRAAEKEVNLSAHEARDVSGDDSEFPVWHGGGWLPPFPGFRTWVKTPSVYFSTSKWAVRPLLREEFLAVYDWSDAFIKVLGPQVHTAEFPRLHPVKSLVAGVLGLAPEARRLLNHEGGVFSPVSEAHSPCSPCSSSSSSPAGSTLVATSTSTATTPTRPRQVPQTEEDDPGEKPSKKLKRGQTEHHLSTDTIEDAQQLHNHTARVQRERKATKSDDAEAPLYLWTEHYLEDSTIDWKPEDYDKVEQALETLRSKLFLWKWKRRLMREFNNWIRPKEQGPISFRHLVRGKVEFGLVTPVKVFYRYRWTRTGLNKYKVWHRKRKLARPEDYEAGEDAIERACNSTWWEWSDGSRPFHWRWPKWYQQTIRDGIDVYLSGIKPEYRTPQQDEKDPVTKERVKAKLNKVRVRRYIAKGFVVSLTSFFSVPKGEDDIRMVYDGTKSGLNAAMWVPRFGLPTIDTHLRSIEEGTFLADVDVGDCFLNFPLHKNLQALAGVDLTKYFPDPSSSHVWERWTRALMGVKSSPYQAVQGMMVAEEVIRGDPKQEWNVFRWKRVRLNCPGDPEYDPSKPWVSKVRDDERIAADLVGYVDDLRPSGNGRKETWLAARRTASVLNYLGIQDAARKRRDSSRTPGAWAGSVVVTRDDGVYVMSEEEKWIKAKAMVQEVMTMIRSNPKKMDRKRLERIRGFLIHVVRTYPSLKPYIMGLHLTIDGWRHNRDKDGWRLSHHFYELTGRRKSDEEACTTESHKPRKDDVIPQFVEAKPRLMEDMVSLAALMRSETPLPRRVRSKSGRKAVYMFGDASKAGFGRTLAIDGKTYYQFGQWTADKSIQSSNWREAKNLLSGIERAAQDHRLSGLELFIFTDNSTAESAFWKGTSKSSELSGIVLKMRELEMQHDLIIHVIHVSGSRMIGQGTDGLSRADHSNGVMVGEQMTDHIPLNESALVRSPRLKERFDRHMSELNFTYLSPDDWFEERRSYGNYIWAPPPAAAEVVVDLLNKERHKRPESMHLVLVPRLMTGRWRRMMKRSADSYFKIDWTDCWDLRTPSWMTWRGYCQESTCRRRVNVRNGLFCANFCFEREGFAPCRMCFCAGCFRPRGQKPFLVRETLDSLGNVIEEREDFRYRQGRPGDSVMVPFQCDLCHYRNITKRNPREDEHDDREVLEFIRRATLDAFWSRETSTVRSNLRLLMRAEINNEKLGLPPLVKKPGPFPVEDVCGMQAAIAILVRSLDKGKYEQFVQFESVRKTRGALTNVYQASVDGLQDVVGAYEKDRIWISQVPTHSYWFKRFMEGYHRRVGDVIKQDWSIPVAVIKHIDDMLDALWVSLDDPRDKRRIAEMGTWFIVGFCTGLRGEEMLMIELAGTAIRLHFLLDPVLPHFLLKIQGRTKSSQLAGSGFEMPCVAVTEGTGLQPGRWVKRLVDVLAEQGRTTGRLFERRLLVPRLVEFEDDWYGVLEMVQRETELIDNDFNVREKAGILRSLRRGVTAHAKNSKVEEDLIRAINRWRREKKNGDKKGGLQMIDRYADLGAIKPTYLRFSQAL